MENLSAGAAGDWVRRGIDAAGGWEAWAAKRTVEFRKTTVRFAADGKVAGSVVERHRYRLQPSLGMRIESEREGRQVVLINNGGQAWKFIDGQGATDQAARDQAWNSTFGSQYVFAMPFKLTDPGTVLTDAGPVRLPDGASAHAITASYQPGAGSAAGMHTWTYYFDPTTARLLANHLAFGPQTTDYSYTEYADYHTVDGLTVAERRVSYQSNAAAQRLAKTSEITQRDLRFDVPLDESELAPPAAVSAN